MNNHEAKKIAETITNQELAKMFENAKNGIKDWSATSSVNRGMTKGTAWNILAKDFDVNVKHHPLGIKNMIWEFGDYLENKPIKPKKIKSSQKPVHQDPIF